jgi:hypothetical protein
VNRTLVLAVTFAAVVGGVWLLVRPDGDAKSARRAAPGGPASAGAVEPARAPKVSAARPAPAGGKAKVEGKKELAELREVAYELADPQPSFQPAPKMAAQARANLKSIQAARETGEYPERLDPSIVPAPFPRDKWVGDPQVYLNVVEPGRVWQSSTSPSADPLRAGGPTEVVLPHGDRARLAVNGVSGAPVTFTSFDGGAFDNGLSSITVRTGDDGMATAAFTATPDTGSVVNVVAASPYSSGVVQFTVQVSGR